MSKRFTDTGKWDKKWFRELPGAYKLFWQYILDRCDIAGFWDVDFKAAAFFIGSSIQKEKALKYFAGQIYQILDDENNCKYWLIVDFVKFQNGLNLNASSPVHRKIIDTLNSKGIIIKDNTLYDRVYDRVCNTQQVIVIVEDYKGGVGENKLSAIWEENKPAYDYILKFFPKLFQMKAPLKPSEHNILLEKYGKDKVVKMYGDMQNYKPLLQKNESAYLTANKWLQRDVK